MRCRVYYPANCDGGLAGWVACEATGDRNELSKQEFLFAEFLDAIAQTRGLLELKLLGRLAHIGLELRNVRVEFDLRVELGNAGCLFLFDLAVLGFENVRQSHFDLADNGLRR